MIPFYSLPCVCVCVQILRGGQHPDALVLLLSGGDHQQEGSGDALPRWDDGQPLLHLHRDVRLPRHRVRTRRDPHPETTQEETVNFSPARGDLSGHGPGGVRNGHSE